MKRTSVLRRSFWEQAATSVRLLFVLILIATPAGALSQAPVRAEVVAAPAASPQAQSAGEPMTFAVITDFGYANNTTVANVANMVNSWDPEFIVTAGDNSQGTTCNTLCYEGVVGAYYGPQAVPGRTDFIGEGNFWPVPGNHDHMAPTANYLAYFSYLPPAGTSAGATARYYDFVRGPVHFFMLDSGQTDNQPMPDQALQQAFLQNGLAASTAAWQIVVFHRPPYTSGTYHSSDTNLQWPFEEWGADFVIAGHNHIYERIYKAEGDLRYITAGAAGSDTRTGSASFAGLEAYYFGNESGAMKVTASETEITLQYVTTNGTTETVRDTHTQEREAPPVYAWEAYNDLAWASGQLTNGITQYTIPGTGNTDSGLLVDYRTGEETSVTATITASGSPSVQTGDYGGDETAEDTDAYNTFHGIVDMPGVVQYGNEGWWVDVTFTGLDPEKTYTFATSANRAGGTGGSTVTYPNRITSFTLSGDSGAVNASTDGVTVINDHSVAFSTGENTEQGYVARWTQIQPGAEGSFKVRAEGYEVRHAYAFSVFMLAEEIGEAETYALDVTTDGFGSVTLTPAGGLYYEGTTVTLTPVPNPGFAFSHWSGEDAGAIVDTNGTYTLVMDGDKSVSANFQVALCTTVHLVTTGDARIRSSQNTTNYGAETTVTHSPYSTSPQGGLFKWDVSSVPAGSTVSGASLSFYVTDSSARVFGLYDLRREWGESTVTWNSYDGTNSWTTAGAASITGDRYDTNLWNAAAGLFGTAGDVTMDLNAAGVAVLQDWVDDGKPNYGFTVQNYSESDQDYWIVASKENTSGYTAPTLNLTYCVASDDPTLLTSVSELDPFSTFPGTPSEPQTYIASGLNLEDNLAIAAPEGFEISDDGLTYGSDLELQPTEGAVSSVIYVRLTGAEGAFDGDITHTSTNADDKLVAVNGVAAAEVCVSSRVSAGSDDVEERDDNGAVDLDGDTTTGSLQMFRTYGGSSTGTRNWWGLRFLDVDVPQGATITRADVTFRANATSGSTASAMSLWGQLADNPGTFAATTNNVTVRPRTTTSANWSVTPWTSGSDYATPDLSSVVQEIVTQAAWEAGNALAVIGQATVDQNRSAQSFNSDPDLAPLLEICYTVVDPSAIEKEVDEAEAAPGETLTYAIGGIGYAAADLLTDVTVTDVIPAGTTYVMGSAAPAAVYDAGTLTWDIGSNTPGVPGEVTDGNGPGQVVVDSTPTTGTASYASSTTFSHTTGSGPDRLLVVGVSWGGAQSAKTVNSVTYNGVALAQAGLTTQSVGRQVAIYYLLNPPSLTTADVVVTYSGTVSGVAGAVTFAGVDQTAPLGAFASSGSTTGSTPTVDVTTEANDLVFDVVTVGGSSSAPTLSVGAGQTSQWNASVASGSAGYPHLRGAASTEVAVGSSTTMSWTASASESWAIGAVPIKPAAGGSTRTTTVSAYGTLVSAGGPFTLEATFTNSSGDAGTVTPAISPATFSGGVTGVTCVDLTPANGTIAAGGSLTFEWTCTATATGIGSVTLGVEAASDEYEYPEGLSNSVLVVPELAFEVTVDAEPGVTQIENSAVLDEAGTHINARDSNTVTTDIVGATTVTVRATTGQTKVYGETDPTFAYTYEPSSPPIAFTGALSRESGEDVDTYTITQGDLAAAGYQINFVSADFTITPKAVSVTPSAASKTYGDDDPTLTGTLSGFLPADGVTAAYSRATGETVGDGPYTISAVLSPAGVLGNYTITYNTANFTITPKAASVTPAAASKTYGDTDPTLTGTLSGFLEEDEVTATYSRVSGETVAGGPYEISAVLSPAGVLDNYDITYNTASFTINGRPVTVKADDKAKTMGDDDPALTYSVTSGSLAFSDAFTGELGREAGEAVGTYAIRQGSLALNTNYDLAFVPGTLTITAAPQHGIDLEVGWNLVSFNLTPLDDAIGAVLSSVEDNYDLVYAWDGESGTWLKYDPQAGYGNSLSTLDETMGFWIRMTADDTLIVSGGEPEDTDIGLYEGWNLVGYPSAQTGELPGVLDDATTGEGDYSLVLSYRAVDAQDPWKLYEPGAPDWANDLQAMDAGWGYWIKVETAALVWHVAY